MGRKSKLSQRIIDDFCAALEIGATYEIAAAYAGVGERTVYDWLKKGDEEIERLRANPQTRADLKFAIFRRFSQAVADAKAAAAISWLQVIAAAAKSDPAWARWMLQVRHSEYIVKQQQGVDLTSGGGPLTFRVVYDDNAG